MASKHISHGGSHIKALYTIFVQPTLSTNRQRLARNLPAPQQHLTNQTRSFTYTPRPSAAVAGGTAGNKRAARAPEVRTQKWNEEITARILQLVDPETKTLSERVTRYEVLRDLDQKTHRLVQLTPDDPEDRRYLSEGTARSGAVILGRRLFDVVDGPKGWDDTTGYGAGEVGKPAFVVVTSAPPESVRLS